MNRCRKLWRSRISISGESVHRGIDLKSVHRAAWLGRRPLFTFLFCATLVASRGVGGEDEKRVKNFWGWGSEREKDRFIVR